MHGNSGVSLYTPLGMPLHTRVKATFHYAIWIESASKLVADRFETGSKLVADQLRASFEPASVMEFGFKPSAFAHT